MPWAAARCFFYRLRDDTGKTVRVITDRAARTTQLGVSGPGGAAQNQPTMINRHRPTAPIPSPASSPEWPPADAGTRLPQTRRQPPLREVLKGLHVRELEGQTVFDQLFGPAAPD